MDQALFLCLACIWARFTFNIKLVHFFGFRCCLCISPVRCSPLVRTRSLAAWALASPRMQTIGLATGAGLFGLSILTGIVHILECVLYAQTIEIFVWQFPKCGLICVCIRGDLRIVCHLPLTLFSRLSMALKHHIGITASHQCQVCCVSVVRQRGRVRLYGRPRHRGADSRQLHVFAVVLYHSASGPHSAQGPQSVRKY